MKSLGFFLVVLMGMTAAPATAHPHVWVTGEAAFKFEDTVLTRVGMRWQFDAFFSQVLGADFDTNGDGTFDESETQAMKDQVFTSLKDFGYFTHLRTADSNTEHQFGNVEDFSVGEEAGELVFTFDLVLAEPIDLTSETVGLSVYDPTVYVDLILDGDQPVSLAGADAMDCGLEYRQGDEISNQSYFFVPQEIWLSCTGKS